MTAEEANLWNGLLMFEVRDKYLLSEDKYLGEAFASFTDIVRTDSSVKFESIQQQHLKLNRPSNSGKYKMCLLDFSLRINLSLFSTIFPSNSMLFLSYRPFVVITTFSTGLSKNLKINRK